MTEITNEQIKNRLESWDRWRVQIEAEQQKQHKTLFGNGEPGWDEILRRLVGYVEKQEKKQAEAWSDAKKFAIGTAAFVLNTILAILIAKTFMP